ncbi:MAG: 1-aminocyclopropane-1-carboxylate deaminase/D-cysteine desulfhydrase [Allomuricauda sp.]|nr:MAG: 1-aminocyclopropane-1-carboxylate deaminase/D-cysteine desulfhydrase [Allomuricauda sp.]
MNTPPKIQNQQIDLPLLREKGVSLFLKREDLIHPLISGNKYRKLKYNLQAAHDLGHDTLLTFGGAYSNHILATASAGKENGFKTIGVIRGEELKAQDYRNPTLEKAHELGMHFYFVDRKTFRDKEKESFMAHLQQKFGAFYLLPEGGTNDLAIQGCQEILVEEDKRFDFICCSVGTGGTMAGLINASKAHQTILGFSALKGSFLKEAITSFTHNKNWRLRNDYHFGGYAKCNAELIEFINDFKNKTDIPLDPVYTGKMLFGIIDSIKNDRFAPESKILAIHTGGLQGIKGMNLVLKNKNLPTIL